MSFSIPDSWSGRERLSPAWASWLEALPKLVGSLLAEWGLTPDGATMHGFCSVVLPVLTRDGVAAVLKVAVPDPEHEHEHLALKTWAGGGAVLLLRADPRRYAVLLERVHTTDLNTVDAVDACEVVAGLYARLHVPAPPQLSSLTSFVGLWTEQLAALPRNAAVPHRLVDQAVSLARELMQDADSVGTLIHGDLHCGNVLAADREPWLAIDPKPMSGDPHYEVAPLLWNRWEEYAGPLRDAIRERFHAVVDAAELDEDRARDWVVVRMMHQAMWALEDGDPEGWLTQIVTVAKAVQD